MGLLAFVLQINFAAFGMQANPHYAKNIGQKDRKSRQLLKKKSLKAKGCDDQNGDCSAHYSNKLLYFMCET